jgi:hypothetical protein
MDLNFAAGRGHTGVLLDHFLLAYKDKLIRGLKQRESFDRTVQNFRGGLVSAHRVDGYPHDHLVSKVRGVSLFLNLAHHQRQALVHVAAVGAEAMRLAGLPALGAGGNLHGLNGMMGAAGAFAGLGRLMKWKHASPQDQSAGSPP